MEGANFQAGERRWLASCLFVCQPYDEIQRV